MIFIYALLLLILIAANEFASFCVYGWFVSKEITEVYMNLDESKLSPNQFNPAILSVQPCYITPIKFCFFAKYYIVGMGTVPRFSKLEKRINQYYAIALKNGR